MNISEKAAFAAGVTDFDALARFNRKPYGVFQARALPKRLYRCVGGPFDGSEIALQPRDVTGTAEGTLVFRVGMQVGHYAAFTSSKVSWKEAA